MMPNGPMPDTVLRLDGVKVDPGALARYARVCGFRLAETLPASRWALRDIYVLRLRALLADARGDETAYRDLRDRYRAMANELGFEGHIKWAAEMP